MLRSSSFLSALPGPGEYLFFFFFYLEGWGRTEVEVWGEVVDTEPEEKVEGVGKRQVKWEGLEGQ